MGKSKKKSFYGVKIGRQTGIFTSWDGPNGASSSVTGFPGALFQGFQTRAEAEKYIAQDVNQTRGATKKGTASSSSRSAPAALVATAPAPVPAPAVTATRRTRTATTDSQDHFNDGLNEELLSDELDNTTEDYLAAISRPPLAPSPEAPVAAADARRPVVDMDSDNEVPNTPPPPYSTQPPAILAQTTFNTASTSGYLVNPVRSTPSTTMDKLAVSSSQNAPLETAVPSIEEQEKPVTPPPPPLSEEQQRALDLTLAGRNVGLLLFFNLASIHSNLGILIFSETDLPHGPRWNRQILPHRSTLPSVGGACIGTRRQTDCKREKRASDGDDWDCWYASLVAF